MFHFAKRLGLLLIASNMRGMPVGEIYS
ncbi:hypothetical protein EC392_05520 [Lonsdalea populi]|uniref:Uncharacterized protein n=1 Tax=Lonsdalea populi TaxID=1172565 RepID=A0A3N0UK50_9GAMM|nr:leu operon leader peptide [Lonsdalea populi]ROH80907.1 hypothetical protein EC393_04155 [Lonsdalea populi]ROH82889.1 hypothetical protein EC392_05520 [Lonsdalea populi]ROH83010.1 hypothetical protein EC394_05640 [Lonsdalea populi]